MSKVITAVPRNDALVKRAVNNLKECIETLEANPEMIHNGGMIVVFCGEKVENDDIESWVKTYHSIDSALKLVGAMQRAVHKFIEEGAQHITLLLDPGYVRTPALSQKSYHTQAILQPVLLRPELILFRQTLP